MDLTRFFSNSLKQILEKKILYSFICLFNLEETLAIFKGGLCMYMMTKETSNLCTSPHFIVFLTKIKVSFKLFCQKPKTVLLKLRIFYKKKKQLTFHHEGNMSVIENGCISFIFILSQIPNE